MDDRAAMIRAARAWLGMEQGELADAAGVTRQTLSLAERSGRVSDKTWAKMVEAAAARGIELDAEAGVIRRR